MSLRTKNNKSWVKKARGTFKLKEWKTAQQSYWKTTTSTSQSGKKYTNTVPYFKLHKKQYHVHQDMVNYISKFFSGLL